jgi:cytoskeletal protein CcmA (bactofilin family)
MLFNKKPDNAGTYNARSYEGPADSRLPANLSPTDQAVVPRAQSASPTQSVIDAWLTITGNLESEGDVRVEGQICGDIRCAHLVVGRDAMVSGDIIAEEAVVRGKVKGCIRANRVILQDTACVESNIYHKVLSVDEGASFDGQSCHRQLPFQDEEQVSQGGEAQRRMVAIESIERPNGPVTGDGLRSVGA